MRNLRYILPFVLCTLSLGTSAQDYARISERSIMGTARYVGMGGAMSAIGGDPSSIHDNPAGLGLYRRTELMITFDGMFDKTTQPGYPDAGERRLFMAPQASLIFSMPSYSEDDEGVQFNNLSLSYRRLNTFNRLWLGSGEKGLSLGSLLSTADVKWDIPFCTDRINATNILDLVESGHTSEFAIDWAINISNRWFVGFGVHIQSYFLASDGDFQETFSSKNALGRNMYNLNMTRLTLSGTGCNLTAGLIYRPVSWIRMGFGIQTPTLGSLNTSTSGTLTALTDSLRNSYAPNGYSRDSKFHMPLHLSSSVAFQVGAYGMLAFQYDYFKQLQNDAVHSLRTGIEVIPVMGLYVNAGYAFESTFKKNTNPVPMDPTFERQDTYFVTPQWSQYVSAAVGYRGSIMMVQAAYQYRWQRTNLYAHENASPYEMSATTHRIILTIGWHR